MRIVLVAWGTAAVLVGYLTPIVSMSWIRNLEPKRDPAALEQRLRKLRRQQLRVLVLGGVVFTGFAMVYEAPVFEWAFTGIVVAWIIFYAGLRWLVAPTVRRRVSRITDRQD